ncbi:outer membrane beta-barrel protein [Roseisolibacter sp. H3M3-2]|uniref:outer membrane beta-barrel protein n=1 Tax=Roseisolibacter sp. H3M3-2 TaxID=3031323 RepID=UPI0023DCE1C5|nr:outer membrane beta-barrel protein [Roseisolibacter sp. H3M3-2]MDF1502468.1 hypothetical protein [Roseisolibacter sp. H3M3-2]
MPIRRLAFLALVAAAAPAAAQSPGAVTQPPRTMELGIDAGATIGLGDESSVSIALPASRARVGFFLTNDLRWSLEPAVGLNYRKVEGSDGSLNYDLEVGALYHFRPATDLVGRLGPNSEATVRRSVAYARPFIGLSGTTAGDGDSEVSVGAGLGVKVPWRESLAWRAEANLGYGFDNEALRLGALLGLSFFTRNMTR